MKHAYAKKSNNRICKAAIYFLHVEIALNSTLMRDFVTLTCMMCVINFLLFRTLFLIPEYLDKFVMHLTPIYTSLKCTYEFHI